VRNVLVDAGPLVAILDRGDGHHAKAVATLREIQVPLLTVWPAFTEAMYFLSDSWRGQAGLWELVTSGMLSIAALDGDDVSRMAALMGKYRDLPMDLADAALVRVAERERIRQIFTFDQKDFRVYRPLGIGRLSLLPQ
jgi:uncharacterized protein